MTALPAPELLAQGRKHELSQKDWITTDHVSSVFESCETMTVFVWSALDTRYPRYRLNVLTLSLESWCACFSLSWAHLLVLGIGVAYFEPKLKLYSISADPRRRQGERVRGALLGSRHLSGATSLNVLAVPRCQFFASRLMLCYASLQLLNGALCGLELLRQATCSWAMRCDSIVFCNSPLLDRMGAAKSKIWFEC